MYRAIGRLRTSESYSVAAPLLIVSSDSTSCHEFAAQFGLVIFLYAKNFHILGEIGWIARVVYSNDPWVCVCVCVCVCARTLACVRA